MEDWIGGIDYIIRMPKNVQLTHESIHFVSEHENKSPL